MAVRRAEDIESCRRLGAETVHFDIPDCIYRRSPKNNQHLYASEEALWISVHPDEEELVSQIATEIHTSLPAEARLVCPITLGNHVDHRLTRMAAERLEIPLLFYADYPYVLERTNLIALENHPATNFLISDQALQAWQMAVAAHQSQISTFWSSQNEMRSAIRAYRKLMGGIKLFN